MSWWVRPGRGTGRAHPRTATARGRPRSVTPWTAPGRRLRPVRPVPLPASGRRGSALGGERRGGAEVGGVLGEGDHLAGPADQPAGGEQRAGALRERSALGLLA